MVDLGAIQKRPVGIFEVFDDVFVFVDRCMITKSVEHIVTQTNTNTRTWIQEPLQGGQCLFGVHFSLDYF